MTDLRKIDIGDTAVLPTEEVRAGAVPEMRWIEIADLRIDDAYQDRRAVQLVDVHACRGRADRWW
jgi:hypothetical protein